MPLRQSEQASANPLPATHPVPMPTRLEHCLVCAQASGEAVHGQGWTKGVVQHEGLQQAQRLLPDQGGLVVQTACKGGRGTRGAWSCCSASNMPCAEKTALCLHKPACQTHTLPVAMRVTVSQCPKGIAWCSARYCHACRFKSEGLGKDPTISKNSYELSSNMAALWSVGHKVGGSTACYCMGAPAGLPFW